MLDPEDYLAAAYTATVEDLSLVFEPVVFDPPMPWLDAGTIAERVTGFVPKPRLRRRPPPPPSATEGPDPMEGVERRAVEAKRRRQRTVDLHMQGAAEADLTSRMRAAGWPGAAHILVDVLAIDADPDMPVAMVLGKDLIVDPDGGVSHLTPVGLQRLAVTDAVAAGSGSRIGDAIAEVCIPQEMVVQTSERATTEGESVG